MVKLSSLSPRLTTLRSAIAYLPQGERERDAHRGNLEWRKWYKTSRWQKLRWSILVRDCFTCQMCGKLEGNASQLVADHKCRHRGNEAMFWDAANIQCVCKPCHDGEKQMREKAQR